MRVHKRQNSDRQGSENNQRRRWLERLPEEGFDFGQDIGKRPIDDPNIQPFFNQWLMDAYEETVKRRLKDLRADLACCRFHGHRVKVF